MTEPTDNQDLPAGSVQPEGEKLEGMGFNDMNPETQGQMLAVMATGTEEQQAQAAEHLGLAPNTVPPEPKAEEAAPVPAAEVPEEPLEPLDPNKLMEQKELPFYAGEFKGMPNVELVSKILEEGKHEKLGSVLISNFDHEELKVIHRLLLADVVRHQRERYLLMADAKKNGRTETKYQSFEVGEGQFIYVTEKEQESLTLCSIYERTLRQGHGAGLFDDQEDHWTNLPKRGDHVIAAGLVNWETSKDPINRIRGKLNLSVPIQKPMWASGFRMEIEGPGVLEQLKLETQLLFEKVDEGRDTTGFVYSAAAVYMNRLVANFILDHVRSTTAGTTDVNILKSLILLTDLENMALITAAAIWPDGYNLKRKCLDSKGGCGHEVDVKLNPRRMLLVRDNRISDAQFQLLTKRSGVVDHEIIRNYQKMTRPEISRYVKLKNGLTLRMKVPTLAEYERVAGAWMERMSNRAKELIGSNASEQDRQVYLQRANNIALIMAFGHWFDAFVEFGDDLDAEPEVILSRYPEKAGDPEAQHKADLGMDRMLEDLSGDTEMVDIIIQAVEKFINDMTLATAVITKEECPVCRKDAYEHNASPHPHVININAVELFFTLLHHKVLAAGG